MRVTSSGEDSLVVMSNPFATGMSTPKESIADCR